MTTTSPAARGPRLRGPDGRFVSRATHLGRGLDLRDPSLHGNRELSWLEFNRRVLALAAEPSVPLLERLRFVAIFADNLDEFFMVRVAGLRDQVAAGLQQTSPDGLDAEAQLEMIARRVRGLVSRATEILHDQILPRLARRGIGVLAIGDLDERARARLAEQFEEQVFPVLTPLAVDPGHPFPYISNLSLSLAVTVRDVKTGALKFARVKVPEVLPRFLQVPGTTRAWVPLEELIADHLDRLFNGMEVVESYAFRVTRNADLDVDEDEAEDLLLAIEQQLSRRRFGAVVRLEVDAEMPDWLVARLQEELDVGAMHTYRVRGLLGRRDLWQLAELDQPSLRYPAWHPVPHPDLLPPADGSALPAEDVFAAIRRRPILVRHPYQSFTDTVERFITAAAEDPQVLAIKQTVYRTSGDSPIVRALIRAAEAGKQVVALIELKARFDEQANIGWARALERAGVHVVYGLPGLKTHVKCSLVVRREEDGLRRYIHLGTGNYHPDTARLYTDLGLLSADDELGEDLAELFNYLTGYARHDRYRRLLVAPVSLREQCTRLIDAEIAKGSRGRIRLKLNALGDQPLICDLYRASRAGVTVDLIVRGICTLRPGIPGVSDRIRVISVVSRLLEHERIMQFGDRVWIGSADWMPRNLDRRVEAMVPVDDPRLAAQLSEILDVTWASTGHAWELRPDGTWEPREPSGPGSDRRSSQHVFMAAAAAAASTARGTAGGGP